MDTTRQNKINRMLQKELSEVFLTQTKAMHGVLVSVSQVRVSPDLSTARVYLSIFPNENIAAILKNIQDNARSIRYELAGRLRFQLRRMPELSFFLDDSLDYAENIDAILNKINPK
jgi:ribosome-binding factor A